VLGRGSQVDPDVGARMAEPETLRSADGALQVRLEAVAGAVRIAGREATVYGYNGGRASAFSGRTSVRAPMRSLAHGRPDGRLPGWAPVSPAR
jgi:hypothetical protein